MSSSDPPSDERPLPPVEAGFERLFEAHVDRLTRFVYAYVRSWEDAENLVQDLFLKLWRQRETLREIENLEAYLHRLARNRALDFLKRRDIEARGNNTYLAPEVVGVEPVIAPEAEQRLEDDERTAAILRALDDLPGRQREVIELRWRDQLTYEEIGARLGIASKTVATHMARALEHLREGLRPQF